MKRNKLLNVANWICKIGKVVFIAVAIVATIFIIHWNADPGFYKNFILESNGVDMQYKIVSVQEVENPGESVMISELSRGVVLFNYFKFLLLIGLSYLIIGEAQRIIQSIKHIQTFRQRNIQSFQNIGRLLVGIFLVDMFSLWEWAGHTSLQVELDFSILIAALAAFILAEVFKEGNQLLEENKLTI